jgi:hypothetical protein
LSLLSDGAIVGGGMIHAVEAAKASSIKAPDFCFPMQLKQQKHEAQAPDFCLHAVEAAKA